MGDVSVREARRTHVQHLRRLARECGAPAVRDDAKREKVAEMMDAIRQAVGHSETKATAEAIFLRYGKTFDTLAVAATAEESPVGPPGFRLRGKSFLFTYNWDYLNRDLPDGTPHLASAAVVWNLWREWKARKKRQHKVLQSTSTLEASLDSVIADRVHLHWTLESEPAGRLRHARHV